VSLQNVRNKDAIEDILQAYFTRTALSNMTYITRLKDAHRQSAGPHILTYITKTMRSRLHSPVMVYLFWSTTLLLVGCGTPTVHELPTYMIDQDQVAATVEAIELKTGQSVLSGETDGAAWIGQIPYNWNGNLVIYAHGFRGENSELTIDPAPEFEFLVEKGFAWAASSYRRNSYDPGVGVQDTRNLTVIMQDLLRESGGELQNTYITGMSMGGHITVAAIEQYPSLYQGALPMCGVIGDVELFDYFLDYNLGAAAIAGIPPTFTMPDEDWVSNTVVDIKAAFSSNPNGAWAGGRAQMQGESSPLTEQGEAFKSFVETGSGGKRVTFDLAWIYWHGLVDSTGDFFYSLGADDGTLANRPGLVAQNVDMSYQTEYGFEIDDQIKRQTAASYNRDPQNLDLPAPIVRGEPEIPVLSIHTTGDLFVPIEMQQIYAQEIKENDRSHLLVQRAIRDVGHCSFTSEEIQQSYTDLFSWVETGDRPLGEDLSGDISAPDLGCQFTKGDGGSGLRSFVETCSSGE
jgi:pimeloyl-ACP methyl ester carboxylesterase